MPLSFWSPSATTWFRFVGWEFVIWSAWSRAERASTPPPLYAHASSSISNSNFALRKFKDFWLEFRLHLQQRLYRVDHQALPFRPTHYHIRIGEHSWYYRKVRAQRGAARSRCVPRKFPARFCRNPAKLPAGLSSSPHVWIQQGKSDDSSAACLFVKSCNVVICCYLEDTNLVINS